MKTGYTHVTVVMDASGSMQQLAPETILNYNRLIEQQKGFPSQASLTRVQFNTRFWCDHFATPLQDAPALDGASYRPSGYTALLDALGRYITETGQWLAGRPEHERPEKVVFVVITDGAENSSREYSFDRVREMVRHQQEKYSWNFVFMGANIDAFAAGAAIGVAAKDSLQMAANAAGITSAYMSTSRNLSSVRMGKKPDMSWTRDDRDAQKGAGA